MNQITVVGLGAGNLEQMPLGIYRLLKNTPLIYLRTKEHPVVQELENEGLQFRSFDHIYEGDDQFSDVYQKIVDTLLELAKDQSLIYAVPGHPLVAERTVQLLLEQGKENHIDVKIIGGQSFLDALFTSVKIDPIEGFQLLDGTDFDKSQVQLTQHLVIGQVYDMMTASNVKLELMELLPDTYEVYLISGAGTDQEKVKKIPLYLLDHDFSVDNLASVYVPPVRDEKILYKNFNYLRNVIKTLRGPNGCPWDRKQTHESLKKYLLEEAYEVLEAIDEKDDDHLVEELGDVLLQVLLHAQIGEDEGYFSIDDVISALSKKMIDRHPHVFGDVEVSGVDDVLTNWQDIKNKEQNNKSVSLMDEIHKGLPALMQSYEIQKQAKKAGFDWEDFKPALAKVKEELSEMEREIESRESKQNLQMEIGDLLFAIVNLARLLKIHPEEALIGTNQKFIKRFRYIEEQVRRSGKGFNEFSLDELDEFWNQAKLNE